MEVTTKLERLRIVYGEIAVVEHQLNQLLDDYSAVAWSFFDCAGKPTAAVVLLNNSELRKAAFVQAGQMRRN